MQEMHRYTLKMDYCVSSNLKTAATNSVFLISRAFISISCHRHVFFSEDISTMEV